MNSFWSIVNQDSEKIQLKQNDEEKSSDFEKESEEALTVDDCRELIEVLENKTDIKNNKSYAKVIKWLKKLRKEWIDISEYERIYVDKYQKFKQKNTNYKNMINYVSCNSNRKPSKERTEKLYHRYIFESSFLLLEQQKKEYLENWPEEKMKDSSGEIYDLYDGLKNFLSKENELE